MLCYVTDELRDWQLFIFTGNTQLVEELTLKWKVGRQHADVVERNLSSVSIIEVDTKQLLILVDVIIIIIIIIIITGRLTDDARVKTGELLTPVSTDTSAD